VDTYWQCQRAQRLMNQHPVNSRQVNVPTRPQPTVIQLQNRVTYPPYQLNYHNGTMVVSSLQPPPVPNQHEHFSPHTYSMFTERDLPLELFRIEPPRDRFKVGNDDIPVPMLYDSSTNTQVVTNRGASLRYFSFLPRYIAQNVSGALLEYWFRLDYRLEMNDILMRIETPPNGRVTANTLNMRRNRFRAAINVNSWMDCRTFPPQHDLDVVRRYTEYQICLNTCLEVDLPGNMFLKPSFNDVLCTPASRMGYIDAGCASDAFLSRRVTNIPTRRMIGIMSLLQKTQDLAIFLGHGNGWDNYSRLAANDAPPWWNDRRQGVGQAQGRPIAFLSDWTWRQWMVSEVGSDMQVGIAKRARTRGWRV